MDKQPSTDDQKFLARINKIIEDHMENEYFSIEELSRLSQMDRSTLHRKLKRLTGKSASQLITEKRLIKARELLENNVATATEIAYQIGFRDQSYFTKVFKKYYKLSPGDVRKGLPISTDTGPTEPVTETPGKVTSHNYRMTVQAVAITLIVSLVSFGAWYFFTTIRHTEKSIAVLPLQNLTGKPENNYFVEGMHDALIGELGKIESVRVISRTSTLRYQDSDMLLKDIAEELGVNTIVEGSVQCFDDSLCFIVQVIDVYPKERHKLSNEYYDDLQNVLNVQSRVVKDIADEVRINLSKEQELAVSKARTVNPEVYKDYLRGMYYLNQGTPESFDQGLQYMNKAIERDPADPLAFAGLALAYAIRGHAAIAPEESFRKAQAAAERAIRIDPTRDEAYTALAMLYLYNFWDWPRAKKAFEDALASNPNNEIAHAHFAWYHVLFNDMEKALYHAERACVLDPFSAAYCTWLAWLYHYNGQYDKAEIWARKGLELKPDIPFGNLVLGWTYLEKGQYQEAIELHEKLPRKKFDNYAWFLGYTYVKTGNREKALALWDELEAYSKNHPVNPTSWGMFAGALGYKDKAFELLHEAFEKKIYPVIHIETDPNAEFIRDDPRYNELLRKMNLPATRSLMMAQE